MEIKATIMTIVMLNLITINNQFIQKWVFLSNGIQLLFKGNNLQLTHPLVPLKKILSLITNELIKWKTASKKAWDSATTPSSP